MIIGLVWMLDCQRTQREFFSGASMRSGLSVTDDDQAVQVGAEPAVPVEPRPPSA